MNKTRNLLLIVFFLIGASGCSIAGEEEIALTPLNQNDWPTPVPAEAASSPTPFPKVGAAVQEAIMAREAARKTQRDKSAQTADVPDEQPAPTPALPTPIPEPSPTATPPPAAAETEVIGTVSSIGLNVRAGAGANFDILQELRQGDQVAILATDPASHWVNVQTGAGLVGWVNANFLTFEGDLDQVQAGQPLVSTAASRQPGRPASAGGRLLIQRQGGGDILIIDRDGTGLRHLTTGIDPSLSPDGSKVAFTRWDGVEQGSLWVANSDGSGEFAVIGEIKQVKSPSWSPDSKQIAVNFQEGGTLEVVRKCKRLDEGEPDINFWIAFDIEFEYINVGGQLIPFKICWKLPPDPHWRLRVVDLTGPTFEDLPSGEYAFAPAWDPANSWRVVSADRMGLISTDVTRGLAASLTSDPSDRAPTFSPDGRYIAVTYKQDNHWEVHRLNADGSGRVRLTKTPLYATVEDTRQWNNASPVFSPDGTEIAFLTDRRGPWEVWVMNLDGSNQRPMFSAAVNDQLAIVYHGNDARMLGWGQ